MATALETRFPIAVIDEDGVFQGIVDRAAIIREVNEGMDDQTLTPTALSEIHDGLNEREGNA